MTAPLRQHQKRRSYRWAAQHMRQEIRAAREQGQPIDRGLRRVLEGRFGLDLSPVRFHTHNQAAALASALDAQAFACGTDVFFATDAYQPDSEAGLRLIEHEIAHVIQQARYRESYPGDAEGVYLSSAGDPWEREVEAALRVPTGQSIVLAPELADVSGAVSVHQSQDRLIIQRHDSFEHRVLGDVSTSDLVAIATNGANRTDILNREINLLWLWHQNPEAVTEDQIHQLCPWINVLRLNASGLLVTYGELNALPDYIATAPVADTIPKAVLLPILQFIRQEGYIQLSKLLNRTVSTPFQDSVFSPYQWAPGLINKLLESVQLDALTQGLGIKGVDHYSALLGRNACHFAPYSWYRWQSSYLIARDLAARAHGASDPNERARLTHQAWVYHGYADHFLQDSFAAGHLVNKTLIMQWFIEWAATQSTVPVADWDFVKNVTTILQPDLAGHPLYNPGYTGGSNDPQTAEDQASYDQRLRTTGVVANPTIGIDAAYQNYFTFLSSLITQSSSAAIHDYYNTNSLWVGSVAHPAPYEVWGDDTLLSGPNGGSGVQYTSEAAQQSQQSIRELLSGGQTSITAQHLRDQFPTSVRSGGQMLGLEAWNDTQRSFCAANIFPTLHDIIVRVANPRIANLSQDQDLTPRWSANLANSGFNVTSMLQINGRVFAGSNGYAYEIDSRSGQVIHQLLVTGSIGAGNYETRLASNGQMLFVGVHGYVYAISLNDWSRLAWTASLPNARYTIVDVLVYANRLFAGSNGYAYELNPGNGQVIHNLLLGSIFGTGDYTMTLKGSGQMLFAGTHGYAYGINLNNWGSAAWDTSLPRAGYTLVDVLVQNNRLFVGSNGYVYELNPSNGRVIHSLLVTESAGVGDYTTRLDANDIMLFAGVHGYVYAIALDGNWSGAAWSADLYGNRYTNANVLTIGNDQLLAGSYGYVYRINPANGQIIRSTLMSWVVGIGDYETRMATDGQTLYAGVHGYAYGLNLCWHITTVGATGSLTSFPVSGNSPRVYYPGTDGHLHEFCWGGNHWSSNDLTAIGHNSPVNAISGSALASFALYGDSPRVYYLGTDGHLHELWWSGTTWSHNDLTATARNNPVDPLPDSALAGFGLNGNSPRVYYQGTDNHIHELWWSGTFWSHNDLTATAQNNPVPAATGSALTAFAIGSNSPRVYYQGTDSHVHELWYDGTAWHNNDLTATAQNNPAPTATDSALSSFALGGTSPRVYYQSSDGHVHELWWSGSAWSHNDLTIIAHNNPVLAAAGSAISSFSLTGNFPRVYYQGGDNHIHELWYGGSGWSHNDLTATAQNNPAPAATDSAVSSFALEGNSPRVYYQGSDNHIHELCWTGTFWTHNDLSAISH